MAEKEGRYDGSTADPAARNRSVPESAEAGKDMANQQVENLRRDKAKGDDGSKDLEADRRKMPGEPT
ncbi:MAG TPA: hypothetical protein VEB20_02145 [Azospirillaceae bacterium]|nr:hypothetical protein [Azospirillaceae bacterium]